MNNEDRKTLVDLMKRSSLFPEWAKKVLLAAFFNKIMSNDEAGELLRALRKEKEEIGQIDESEQKEIEALNKKYGLS